MLQTEAEYEAALELAWTLMDAEPGSIEEMVLEELAILIQNYERIWG
jgi:antitoxin component HigA of HigAB toxin-antitoxin module